MSDTETLIIGGGISGLSCAAVLRARHPPDSGRLRVLETSGQPGGKMQTDSREGFLCERGPTTMLDNVAETRALVDSLGLTPEWIPGSEINHNRFIWRDDRRIQLPAPPHVAWKALTSPIFSPAGKLRMALEPFAKQRAIPGESLRSFATRRLGAEACRNLLEPFATGIHACDPTQLEVESAFPKLARAEREYGNLFPGMFKLARQLRQGAPRRKTMMRSFQDGLGRLPKRIAEELGGALSMHHHVNTIEPANEGFRVHVETPGGAQEILARQVVLAVPHNVAGRILGDLPGAAGLATELRAIGLAPVAVVHIGVHTSNISEPINGFGHLVVRGGTVRTLGSIYSSSVFPGRTPSDDIALFTNFTGGTLDPHALELSDEELTAFVTKDLEAAVGLRGDPDFTHVTRWPEAFPQYHVGHFARCERIRRHAAAIPGLILIGNYLDGLSINDCIRSATLAATGLLDAASA
ncbi:MAG: protoporphyrinogen oxidase [Verrucomicrobia bacterium]|nr:protoporphyrinogen oxidase [Verrucomicrobiota bacterium]MDA1087252.1 protoporphyrinogen oxidase [Verrucomicrobiota bacterium]